MDSKKLIKKQGCDGQNAKLEASNRPSTNHWAKLLLYSLWFKRDLLWRDVLALSVEILDEVLEEVDAFLHFDLVHFQEILQRETRREN